MSKIGKQENNTWVFAPEVFLSSSGQLLDSQNTEYVSVGHLFHGPGVAGENNFCAIELPLTTDPLCSLMESLRGHLAHNFMPCVPIHGICCHASPLPDIRQEVQELSNTTGLLWWALCSTVDTGRWGMNRSKVHSHVQAWRLIMYQTIKMTLNYHITLSNVLAN